MGEILMTASSEREGDAFEKAIEKMETLVAFRFSSVHPEVYTRSRPRMQACLKGVFFAI